jgi:hypothetical protein
VVEDCSEEVNMGLSFLDVFAEFVSFEGEVEEGGVVAFGRDGVSCIDGFDPVFWEVGLIWI